MDGLRILIQADKAKMLALTEAISQLESDTEELTEEMRVRLENIREQSRSLIEEANSTALYLDHAQQLRQVTFAKIMLEEARRQQEEEARLKQYIESLEDNIKKLEKASLNWFQRACLNLKELLGIV